MPMLWSQERVEITAMSCPKLSDISVRVTAIQECRDRMTIAGKLCVEATSLYDVNGKSCHNAFTRILRWRD